MIIARIREHRRLLILLGAVGAICAVLTFSYFDNYAELIRLGLHSRISDAVDVTLVIFTVSAPFVLLWALVAGDKEGYAAARVHAACFLTLIIIAFNTNFFALSRQDLDGGSTDHYAADFLMLFAPVDMMLLFFITIRTRRENRVPPLLFAGLATALIAGWALGFWLWSERVPPRVIAAAEAVAGENPYCIDVAARAAQSRRDLTASRMRAVACSWEWYKNFHATLKVGDGAGAEYWNWSYRSGKFELVSAKTRESLHLDTEMRCIPVARFSAGLT